MEFFLYSISFNVESSIVPIFLLHIPSANVKNLSLNKIHEFIEIVNFDTENFNKCSNPKSMRSDWLTIQYSNYA